MRIAACQPFEVLGEIDTSISQIAQFTQTVEQQQVDLICFPECYVGGYFKERELALAVALDLSSPAFNKISSQLAHFQPTIVMGITEHKDDKLFNTAIVLNRGNLIGRYRKQHLLGSESHFSPGNKQPIFSIAGTKVGINICYDNQFTCAATKMVAAGAKIILCPSNNMLPTAVAKKYRDQHNPSRAQRAKEHQCWYISSDVTGNRKGHLAYGPTAAINPNGEIIAQVPIGQEGIIIVDV